MRCDPLVRPGNLLRHSQPESLAPSRRLASPLRRTSAQGRWYHASTLPPSLLPSLRLVDLAPRDAGGTGRHRTSFSRARKPLTRFPPKHIQRKPGPATHPSPVGRWNVLPRFVNHKPSPGTNCIWGDPFPPSLCICLLLRAVWITAGHTLCGGGILQWMQMGASGRLQAATRCPGSGIPLR